MSFPDLIGESSLDSRSSQGRFLQQLLIDWFQKNQRPLPWRKTYDPYQVWISEIMLQQTQVKTALPYFERWMKKFPTIRAVAEAREDTILKLWEGLGYYSRARNIQKAAQKIMKEFKSKFPEPYEDILSLPGIGKYTAGAIASIAFSQDRPVVDGNVIRVIARLFNFKKNVRFPQNLEFIWKRVGELLPPGHARQFNQALMELGALICNPKNPDCNHCPVQKMCTSYSVANMNELPNLGQRQKLESIRVALAVIRKGNKVFIQKRPSHGLMGGLWEFPGGKVEKRESVKKALLREIKEELGIKIANIQPLRRIHHGYTRFKVDLHCFSADYAGGRLELNAAAQGKWVQLNQLKNYPFPAANTQLIKSLYQT